MRARFGSWCYSGTVQLTPTLALVDIPHVIPALRMQQSKLDFMCDVTQVSGRVLQQSHPFDVVLRSWRFHGIFFCRPPWYHLRAQQLSIYPRYLLLEQLRSGNRRNIMVLRDAHLEFYREKVQQFLPLDVAGTLGQTLS